MYMGVRLGVSLWGRI